MSQNKIISWTYMAPSSLWEDCDHNGVSTSKSVFHLSGSIVNQVSLATIYLNDADNSLFSIEYYKQNKIGGLHYDGLRETFKTIELALFSISLRARERFDLEITYDQALKEYYEYKEANGKGNNK